MTSFDRLISGDLHRVWNKLSPRNRLYWSFVSDGFISLANEHRWTSSDRNWSRLKVWFLRALNTKIIFIAFVSSWSIESINHNPFSQLSLKNSLYPSFQKSNVYHGLLINNLSLVLMLVTHFTFKCRILTSAD